MKPGMSLGASLAVLLSLRGCANPEAAKASAYQMLYQKGCMDRYHLPDCDPNHKSYEEFKKDRERQTQNFSNLPTAGSVACTP